MAARCVALEIADTRDFAEKPGHHVKRDTAGVRLASGGEDLDTTRGGDRRNVTHETCLANAGLAHHAEHSAVVGDGTSQQALDGRHLPPPANQTRLRLTYRAVLVAHLKQAARGHRVSGTLDLDHLRFSKERDAVDQTCSRCAEHDPARGSRRFHPLRHTDLLADGCVTKSARTYFTGNHPAGVQTHPQL